MTIEEFDIMKFRAGMNFFYHGKVRKIASVNFEEKLIGVIEDEYDPNEISWARCENVTVAKSDSLFELLQSNPKP